MVEIELHRVAPVKLGLRDRGELRPEAAVDLDRVHVRDPLGEKPGQDAESRANFENDVVGVEPGEPLDHSEDVVVDQEVLAEALARRDRHSANTRVAFSSICCSSAAASTPRTAASASSV